MPWLDIARFVAGAAHAGSGAHGPQRAGEGVRCIHDGRMLAFHRLVFARRRTAWWTPLVVGLLGVALYLALLLPIFVLLVVAVILVPESLPGFLSVSTEVAFDMTDPLMVAVLLGSIALMLPAYVLSSLIVNGRGVGFISSVAGRLRWRWMLVCGAVALALAVALTLVSLLLPAEEIGDPGAIVAPGDNPRFFSTLIVLLLVVPFQAAAEEYVFRGYLMQAIGRWLRHPAFAILLPVPLFVLGHLYDPLGQAGVAVFAIAAGWITWRTGGLEAAIALHVVNNLLAFGLGLFGLSDVNATSPGLASFVWSFVLVAGFVGVVEVLFRRSGLARTVAEPVRAPVPALVPAAPVAPPISPPAP